MNMASPTRSATKEPGSSTMGMVLQRKCACGTSATLSGECGTCQKKKQRPLPLQTKLLVGSTDDPLEREADRVADQVMRMPDAQAVHRSNGSNASPLVLRQGASSRTGGAGAAPPIVNQVLSAPGQALDPDTRDHFEPRFGLDFSRVRVHTDALAAASTQAVHARAYTVGEHIVMGSGEYAPGSRTGGELLAHELSHVVQQSKPARLRWPGGSPSTSSGHSDPPVVRRFPLDDWVPDPISEVAESVATGATTWAIRALEALGPPDRADFMGMVKAALGNPLVSPLLLMHPALQAHPNAMAWMQTDAFWDFIENPQPFLASAKDQLLPHILRAQSAAVQSGDQLLFKLGVGAEHQEIIWTVLKQVASLAEAAFGFVIDDILLDSLLFWELRSEHEIYDAAWSKYEGGETDVLDLIAEHIAILLNVVGRVEDLMPLVLAGTGVAAGGTVGGAAGTVVPGAGNAVGAGGGSTVGGASGLAISEVLGLVAVLGPAGLEVVKATKAAAELIGASQDEKQRSQDIGQLASSAFSILVMAALAFLPGLAIRTGRKLGNRLVRDIVPHVDALLAGSRRHTRRTPTDGVAHAQPDAAHPDGQIPPEFGLHKPRDSESHRDIARAPMNVEASVQISQHKSNADINPEEVSNEILYVDRHQEQIQGVAPERKAPIGTGEHHIVESPGGCKRHSGEPLNLPFCPIAFNQASEAAPNVAPPAETQGALATPIEVGLPASSLATLTPEGLILREKNEAKFTHRHGLSKSLRELSGLQSEHLLPQSILDLDPMVIEDPFLNSHGFEGTTSRGDNYPTILIDAALHRAGMTYGRGAHALLEFKSYPEMVDAIIADYSRLLSTPEFSHLDKNKYLDGLSEFKNHWVSVYPEIFDSHRNVWEEFNGY